MQIDFLVEEPSMEAALNNLLPKLLPTETSIRIRVFQGKQDLLKRLPVLLKGYKGWIDTNHKIVVLVDRDIDDCYRLKRSLEEIAQDAQMITKSSAGRSESFQVLNRIVIGELESWFLGDRNAIKAAYPAISPHFVSRSRMINPDELHQPSKKLEKILQRAKYYSSGMPKIEVAQNISSYMDPDRNCSRSFQVFWSGLQSIVTHV
ncbi:MAG: DUF4276 family protein [Methanolinea sp.]|jgi:hypothetical protein|nr:DUF4276 family protein [Methanolinea sp.]